jgi:uncharacterized membrane protein
METYGQAHGASRRVTWASFVIGVALSGFFDGILLHQVLQWHHLLSLVPGETFRDLRTQVYWDGLFHVLMYAVAVAGLWLLWRARSGLTVPDAAVRVAGGSLLGFGAWNIVDVGLFHWILGIHRVRLNVPNPLAYDLAWLAVLGLGVSFAGMWLMRRRDSGGRGGSGRGAAMVASVLLLGAIPVANLPARDGSAVVVFRPDVSAGRAANAIVDAGARIVMLDPEGGFAVVRLAEAGSTLPLYRAGALLVTRSPALAGCLAFSGRG